jgi:serine/threonine protein kinase
VYDIDVTSSGLPFLVMELLEGRSLEAEMRVRGAAAPARAAQLLLPVCDLLAEAHASALVHRDIKPANIFLHRDRAGETVKVVDFGLAKFLQGPTRAAADDLSGSGEVAGTAAYVAPERWRNEPYDGKCDIYALGVVLYRLLTARLPFRSVDAGLRRVSSPSLRRHRPELEAAIDEVAQAALELDPVRRPDAVELGRRLSAAAGVGIDAALHRHLAR